jgi:hypothetical protein
VELVAVGVAARLPLVPHLLVVAAAVEVAVVRQGEEAVVEAEAGVAVRSRIATKRMNMTMMKMLMMQCLKRAYVQKSRLLLHRHLHLEVEAHPRVMLRPPSLKKMMTTLLKMLMIKWTMLMMTMILPA